MSDTNRSRINDNNKNKSVLNLLRLYPIEQLACLRNWTIDPESLLIPLYANTLLNGSTYTYCLNENSACLNF